MAMLRSYLKKVVRLSHALVSQLHSLYGQTGNRATADRPTRFSSNFFSWCSFVTPARLTTGILLLFGTSLQAADTLTLNLGNLLSYYTQTTDGYWEDTYIDGTNVEDTVFFFSHSGSSDAGGGMAYWDGFTICTSGDNNDYGTSGSSDGWISKQWGCMAGGGLDADGDLVTGAPYLVGYWGFFPESLDNTLHTLRVDFADNKEHKAIGVYICNHPWPYYGNINGDGFAGGFSQEGDYFALIAHGLNVNGEPTGVSVKFDLATYHNGALHQSDQWEYMDLTALGTVSGIFFTMETSDVDAIYGANTAVYFCMDKLSILEAEKEPQPLPRPSGLYTISIGEDSAVLAWDKIAHAEKYLLTLNDTIESGTTTDTTFVFNNLLPATEYTLSVRAIALNDTSEVASLTITTTDETAPSMPADLKAEADIHSIKLTWNPSTDNVGVTRYTVYLNNEAYRRTTDTTHTVTGLDPDTEYIVSVEAEDAAGNKSERATLTVKTKAEEKPIEAIDLVELQAHIKQVMTLDGKPLGTTLPQQPGIYLILLNNDITIKLTINY